MAADPYYKKCVLRNSECGGRIEWHHVWIYAGTQINEKWAIVPACTRHHELVKSSTEIRESLELISLDRATPADLLKYPRKNWAQIRRSLTEKLRKMLSTFHVD